MPLYSYTYSIPYVLFLVHLSLLMFWEFRCIKYNKSINAVRWATIASFLLFFGLRGFVFTDWMSYYPFFEKMPTFFGNPLEKINNVEFSDQFSANIDSGKAGIELGFIYFTALFKTIIPNYFSWIFFNSLIDVLLLNIFFKRHSKYYVLSFILFLVFSGLGIEFNLLRNIKAILLFLISIKYLYERKVIPYILLNLLGFLFHTSALLFIPLYFILHRDWSKKLIWSIFIIGNLIFLFQINYLKPILLFFGNVIGGKILLMTQIYFANDLYNKAYGIGFSYLERIFTFFILMYLYKRLKEQNPINTIFINAYIIYLIVNLYFSEISVAVVRLSALFVFSYWILYPNILNIIKKRNHKMLFLFPLIFYCMVKTSIGNFNIFSKYDNLLFGIESYEVRKSRVFEKLDKVLLKK